MTTTNDAPAQTLSGSGTDELIDILTDGEGDTLTFCCKNPDFNGLPNECVTVNASWTDWQDRDFRADTRLECLDLALRAYREACGLETPKEGWKPDALPPAPAPTPSGCGVREDATFLAAILRVDAQRAGIPEVVREHIEKAAALITSLASDASPRGEAVGYCTDCESETTATVDGRCSCGSGRVIAHPAPATVEMREALEPFSKIYSESIRDWPAGFSLHRDGKRHAWGFNGADLTWGDFRRAHEVYAALAPATEGKP